MSVQNTTDPSESTPCLPTHFHEDAARYLHDHAGFSMEDAANAVAALTNGNFLGGGIQNGLLRWDGRSDVMDSHSAAILALHGHGKHVQRIAPGGWRDTLRQLTD